PGVHGPLVVRDGIAGGPRHVDQFTIDFFYFYKFALIFQHISRLLLNIVKNIEEIALTSATGGICVRGEGAWRRWLVIYPDNCTFLRHCRQNMCAGGGGMAA